MNHRNCSFLPVSLFLLCTLLFSCHNEQQQGGKDKVKAPVVDEHVGTNLKNLLVWAAGHDGKLNDTSSLHFGKLLDSIYEANGYNPLWSDKNRLLSPGDSLFHFIENSKQYGLFPSDYHYPALAFLHRILRDDTLSRKNVSFWARADLLYTDAFFTLVKDLKHGRLDFDSVTLRKDSVLPNRFYTNLLSNSVHSDSLPATLESLQPRNRGYDSLRAYIGEFLATARFRKLTWLEYPYKDSLSFYRDLTRRLQEVGYIDSALSHPDTAVFREAMRNYQRANKLKVTGKISQDMVNMMDNTDWEKFKRIAINMDRYKLLPDSLPSTYVWVNLPAFGLQVVNADTVALESKVIVGSPKTRTPLL